MSHLEYYVDPLQFEQPANKKKWLMAEKRGLLQLPVSRDAARGRLLNAFRSDHKDNKGWIFPRVKYSECHMAADVLTLRCTVYGNKYSVDYHVTGHLIDMDGGGSQIILRLVENLRFRILVAPIFALFPVTMAAYFLGLQGWLFVMAVVVGGLSLAAFGTTLLYFIAMWQRNTALDDVRRFLSDVMLTDRDR